MSLPSTFRKLWAAQTVSAFGARITREGLPIMAVTTLGASAATLGVLAAVASGAALAAALATGGLIDRHRRRPLLIGADLLRAAVLITIPISAGLGVLTLPQVLAAAALVAAASVVFDIASHSYLPSIIGKAELVEGNSRLAATESVAEVGGPALAGLLFQWLSAPIAVAANAVTYLVSAGFLATIRNPEAAPAESPPDHWTRDVTQGFRRACSAAYSARSTCCSPCALWASPPPCSASPSARAELALWPAPSSPPGFHTVWAKDARSSSRLLAQRSPY